MTEINPYQPPKSDVAEPVGVSRTLAGRGQRLGAAFIDGIISIVLLTPVLLALGIFDPTRQRHIQTFEFKMILALTGFAVFAAVHSYLLARHGQTVGKRLLKIKIVNMGFNKPDLGTILIGRYLPIIVLRNIPVVGPFISLVDILFIFRNDRRCLHDLIAGTQVVRCG